MALSDADVRKQLSQMIKFIMQEANEKASEISIQAEEEFNIARQNILQEEKKKINKEFERKMKQVEVKKKIAYSNELNQSRLRVLKSREDVVASLYAEAHQRLSSLSHDQTAYRVLLEKLILQSVLKVGEDEVEIICRAVDEPLITEVLPAVRAAYRQMTQREVNLTVNQVHRLAPPASGKGPSCAGGILLSAKQGRILCNNTLEQRLALAYEALLPTIRITLFGASETRKFTS